MKINHEKIRLTTEVDLKSIHLYEDYHVCRVHAVPSHGAVSDFLWEGVTSVEGLIEAAAGNFEYLQTWRPADWDKQETKLFFITQAGREIIRKWGNPFKSEAVLHMLLHRKHMVEAENAIERLESGKSKVSGLLLAQPRTGCMMNADGSSVPQALRFHELELLSEFYDGSLVQQLEEAVANSNLGPLSRNEELESGILYTIGGEFLWRPNAASWALCANIRDYLTLKITVGGWLKVLLTMAEAHRLEEDTGADGHE